MKRYMYCIPALLAAWLLVPLSAQARTVTLSSRGEHTYTHIGDIGGTMVAVQTSVNNSGCTVYYVGGNGLDEDTTIVGTSDAEDIVVLTAQNTWCDYVMYPLRTNGHLLTLRGGGGNDTVAGGTLGYKLYGDSGNDTVVNWSGAFLYGGDGNDKLRGSWGALEYGENGNDQLCSSSGTFAGIMDGGAGTDNYCGVANSIVSASPAPSCTGLSGCQP